MDYIHTKTIESDSAIVRVFSPILTDEERARRMRTVHKAAEALIKETMKRGTSNVL